MRHMKTAILCAGMALTLGLAGCGQKPMASSASPSPAPATASAAASPSAKPAATVSTAPSPAVMKATVQSYYGNADMTALVQKPATIQYAKEDDKYLAALNTLKLSPSADAVALCPDITFRSVVKTADKLSIDVSLPDKDRLGSGGEAMFLEAVKKTVFQFPEINTFELTVDGSKAESLMGHMELQYPFKRSSK